MNAFLESALRRLIPAILAGLGTWLVSRGWLTEGEAAELVGLLATAVVAGALSVWQTYKSRQEKLTAQALAAPASTQEIKAIVAAGKAPSVKTAAHEVPRLAGE